MLYFLKRKGKNYIIEVSKIKLCSAEKMIMSKAVGSFVE